MEYHEVRIVAELRKQGEHERAEEFRLKAIASLNPWPPSAIWSAAPTARGWFGHPSVARAVTGWPLALARRPGWVYMDVDIYRRIGPTTICFLSAVRPVEPRRL